MIHHVTTVNDDAAVYLLLIWTSIKYRIKKASQKQLYKYSMLKERTYKKFKSNLSPNGEVVHDFIFIIYYFNFIFF